MRIMNTLLVGLAALVVAGCAAPEREPMPVDSSYRVIDNWEDCTCLYGSREGVLYKIYKKGRLFGGKTSKIEVLNSDATKTVKTLTSKDQIDGFFPHPAGTLDENRGTVRVNVVGGEEMVLDLNLAMFPDLFEVGFVIGSLKVLDAMQNEDHVFVALQKPGNIIVLRFDKANRRADKVVLELKYTHQNLAGQIFSFMMGKDSATVHDASFIEDYHSEGNFFFGYTHKVLKGGGVIELIDASISLHDRSGEQIGDLSEEDPSAPYERFDVYGDALVLLNRPLQSSLYYNYDWVRSRAYNKNTLIPVNVENVEYMVAATADGAVYWDPVSQNYFFRGIR